MPLYEYKCRKCDKTFEVMQKFSDAELTKHEGCGGRVEKQMSAPAFQLKGSGWYVTDYGKGNSGAKADSGKSSDSVSEAKSDSKADSKSDAKSDSKPDAKSDSSNSASKSEGKSEAKSSPKK